MWLNPPFRLGAAPGAFKYADLDGQSTIDPNDETYIGNPNPKLTYGLNLNANYKNFDFFASFYGSYGNDIFNYIKYWTVFPQVFEGNVDQGPDREFMVTNQPQPQVSADHQRRYIQQCQRKSIPGTWKRVPTLG